MSPSLAPLFSGLPPFPRSVHTYVGRSGELARVEEMLDREPLFLVYGIAGIGKSEFVYKAVEEARQQPRWRDAAAVLLAVRADFTAEHVVAQLKVMLGIPRAATNLLPTSQAQLDDDLAEIARVLEARPALVFIDDIHHLQAERAAHLLGYLSRHVRASRVFVASRVEIPLPPGTPTPVVTRLMALDAADTAEMLALLTHRLGVEVPDASEVFVRSGGSPFFVQRLLTSANGHTESALEHSLSELAPPQRALLMLVSVLRSRSTGVELAEAAIIDDTEHCIRELSRRFLVDVSRQVVMVHDLVRDALLRQADRDERIAAHAHATRLHQRRYEANAGHGGFDALETVYHLIQAQKMPEAWSFARASYRSIAAAALDHLLLELLPSLREALSDQRHAIDLLHARTLVRRSRVSEAAALIEKLGPDPAMRQSFRYGMLAAEIAQRQGHLQRAEELFRRAKDNAQSSVAHFQAALQLSYVLSLRGRAELARTVIMEGMDQLEQPSVRDRGRQGFLMAVSYILEERFREGAELAARAARELEGSGADDLIVLMAMVEILARVHCNDARSARQLCDRILMPAAVGGTVRQTLASFYSGLVLYAEGDMEGARAALEGSVTYLQAHDDHIMASIATFYLGRTIVVQGYANEAIEVSSRMTKTASAAGLDTLVATSIASHADSLLAAGRAAEARELAEQVLANERAMSHARWMAHAVLMRILALEGDIAGARRLHEQASAGAPDFYRADSALERANIEMMGGDPEFALQAASAARTEYAAQGRRWLEAWAAMLQSGALVARGHSTDIAAVEEPLARAEELSEQGKYPLTIAGCALGRAALWVRAGEPERARAHLMDTARRIGTNLAFQDTPHMAILRAGLQQSDAAKLAPGLRATASMLGLTTGSRYRLVGRDRTWLVLEQDVDRERRRHDLVVEPERATITTGSGQTESGRPTMCELLARIIEGQGGAVSAEALFRDVWGGREYHPLRHRNTVYVALKRLRKTLRTLFGDRQIIETAAGGWRIVDDIDAVSIRPGQSDATGDHHDT